MVTAAVAIVVVWGVLLGTAYAVRRVASRARASAAVVVAYGVLAAGVVGVLGFTASGLLGALGMTLPLAVALGLVFALRAE